MKQTLAVVLLTAVASSAFAEDAYKIDGKTTSVKQLLKDNEAMFYKIEQQKFEMIEQIAQEQYMDHFWQKMAKKEKKSVDAVRKAYFEKNAKVSSSEIKETFDRFKDHPQLKKLSEKEQKEQVTEYLAERKKRDVEADIIDQAIKSGELKILYERPKEPTYDVPVSNEDVVRYGPNDTDIKPLGCKGDECSITVVEYSEFQCPFCSRVLPSVKRLLTEYKGKVRWIVRDFPLSFHQRARPAAIAAHCAANQDKYWQMYTALFDNQRDLEDKDLEKYAKGIDGLNFKKWNDCVKNSAEVEKRIDQNFASGSKLGVSGTPAFFINGRRLSGALPYEEFKRVFDEELKARGKT